MGATRGWGACEHERDGAGGRAYEVGVFGSTIHSEGLLWFGEYMVMVGCGRVPVLQTSESC